MRYLIDTNVLVAALMSKRGASHQILRRVLTGEIPIVIHHKLLWEYRDVTSRTELNARFALDGEELSRLIGRIAHVAQEIPVRYLWRPNLSDEGDNFVLEIAAAAAPCTIVTHNVDDFRQGQLRFPEIAVLTPSALLTRLNH